jgi:hypothetical protein
MASAQARVVVATLLPLMAAAAAAITPAAAAVVVFSAVFSNSVKLTAPRGSPRCSPGCKLLHTLFAIWRRTRGKNQSDEFAVTAANSERRGLNRGHDLLDSNH